MQVVFRRGPPWRTRFQARYLQTASAKADRTGCHGAVYLRHDDLDRPEKCFEDNCKVDNRSGVFPPASLVARLVPTMVHADR